MGVEDGWDQSVDEEVDNVVLKCGNWTVENTFDSRHASLLTKESGFLQVLVFLGHPTPPALAFFFLMYSITPKARLI